jgi:hypothetical protein
MLCTLLVALEAIILVAVFDGENYCNDESDEYDKQGKWSLKDGTPRD